MERYDKDFLGLEVVSLQDASVVGEVEGLIVDDQTKVVAALIVNTGSYRSRVLPYALVRSVGEDAVVVESADGIKLISEAPELEALVERDVVLPGAYLLTEGGTLLGKLAGFLVDTVSGGITSLAVTEEDGAEAADPQAALLIPAGSITSVGPEIVIVSTPRPEAVTAVLTADELRGLPIVSTTEGRFLAEIDDVIITESQEALAGFLVNLGLYEPQAMSFADVKVIGPDAVLTDRTDAITALSARPDLEALAERRVSIEGARTVTLSGKSVGFVLQHYVSPADGSIIGLQFLPETGHVREPVEGYLLPLAKVIRMGRDLVVVEDDFASALRPVADTSERKAAQVPAASKAPTAHMAAPADQNDSGTGRAMLEPAADVGRARPDRGEEEASRSVTPASEDEDSSPADWEVEEQLLSPRTGAKHYLLGRRVLKRLETAGGRLIANVGDVVTPEVIEQARTSDLLLVLSLNVE